LAAVQDERLSSLDTIAPTGTPRLRRRSHGWQMWLSPWMIIEGLFGDGIDGLSQLEPETAQARSGTVKQVGEYGRATENGTRYGLLNQDFAFTKQLPGPLVLPSTAGVKASSGEVHVGAVLDGHGMLGEVSAKTVGQALDNFLTQRLQTASVEEMNEAELQRMFTEAFEHAHKSSLELYNNPPAVYRYPKGGRNSTAYRFKPFMGMPSYWNNQGRAFPLECGTTCTVSVLHGSTVTVAHVGDSTAVMGCAQGRRGGYRAEVITRDHTCKDEDEARRCEAIPGASVTAKKKLRIVLPESKQCHTVAMSRALGHRLLTVDHGLLTTPDVVRLHLQPHHCCLIVASDGVWESLSHDEAVEIVMTAVDRGASAQQAASQLVSRAVSAAFCIEQNTGAADNTTAVVYLFDN